jgi:hypothetical protein
MIQACQKWALVPVRVIELLICFRKSVVVICCRVSTEPRRICGSRWGAGEVRNIYTWAVRLSCLLSESDVDDSDAPHTLLGESAGTESLVRQPLAPEHDRRYFPSPVSHAVARNVAT